MTDKEKIRNIIELFIAWNGETDVIDVANIDSAVEFIVGSLQEEPVSGDFEMALAEMIDNAQKRVVEPWVVAAQWKDELIELAKSEEPISEELNEAAIDYAESVDYRGFSNAPWNFVQDVFKAGAKWKEKHLTKDATKVTVHIDAGGYPYTPEIELYDYDKDVPLAKEGDKYKVILIKEE